MEIFDKSYTCVHHQIELIELIIMMFFFLIWTHISPAIDENAHKLQKTEIQKCKFMAKKYIILKGMKF